MIFSGNSSSLIENFYLALEEISTFEKLKIVRLLINQENVNPIILGKILSNKRLEILQLRLCSKKEKISSYKWDKCFVQATKSEVKGFYITVPERFKTLLFRMNLLEFLQRLESLQVVELVNEKLEAVTFAFLYGLASGLLEKKKFEESIDRCKSAE